MYFFCATLKTNKGRLKSLKNTFVFVAKISQKICCVEVRTIIFSSSDVGAKITKNCIFIYFLINFNFFYLKFELFS